MQQEPETSTRPTRENRSLTVTGRGETGLLKRLQVWMVEHSASAGDPVLQRHKQQLLTTLYGVVLEIGPGTAPNLAYYPRDVHWIGVEPNAHMAPHIEEAAAETGLRRMELRFGVAEQLPAADASIDAVVSTRVLCSVDDQARALEEIRRVLKPGGRFCFIEHVAAPAQTSLRRIQNWVTPIWSAVADGCHPNRETWKVIEQAGFEHVEIEHFRLPIVIAGPHIAGSAVKAK